MVLDTSLINTQQYKVRIKDKVEQSKGRSSALGIVAIENVAFGSPSTTVTNFTFIAGYIEQSQRHEIIPKNPEN